MTEKQLQNVARELYRATAYFASLRIGSENINWAKLLENQKSVRATRAYYERMTFKEDRNG